MEETYDIVIVGGGIVGASIAYHLGALGKHSVCLLERDTLTCGTTWHAAGLVAELRASANLTRLARYSAELYESLERDGYHTGYKRVGALTLSRRAERSVELKRQASMARANGVVCDWLEAPAVAERWPQISTAGVEGGVYMPRDGQTNPVDTTRALARRAEELGVTILEQHPVTGLEVADGRVLEVLTATGGLRAEKVVLAAGLWTRALAQAAGAAVPLYPCEHFYAVTEPVDGLDAMPIVRVPDDGVYLKPDAGRMLIGCFERNAKPLDPAALPADFSFAELPFDLEHFAGYLQCGLDRLPALTEVGIRTWFNGPESFTPDGRYVLGRCPELENLYVAAGFNSIGIQSAGGVGMVMAQWLDTHSPPMDLWEVDVRRFQSFQNEPAYLRARVAESLGLLYDMHWPHRQMQSARGQLASPLHAELEARGAVFGELAGWERANWYADAGQARAYEYSWGKQNWFPNAAREHRAVRETLAFFDQSCFAKFAVTGPEATRLLNRLCTANLDVVVGRVVYCQCLNERGGIESDVTITRVAEDSYFYVTAAPCRVRDGSWLQAHAHGYNVDIEDVTERYAVLGIMGPEARDVLAQAAATDLSDAAFPFATSQLIPIAGVAVRATRITYVGALGWELYVPWGEALEVFHALPVDEHALAGYHAMDSLRMEKAYRHWGHDVTDEDTPLEAGLSFTIDWHKPDGFIGERALAGQRERGLDKRLLLFSLEDPDALLYHDEPIFSDGEIVGHVRSGAFGHSVGRSLGFGYVQTDEPVTLRDMRRRAYEIEVAGVRVPAQAHTRAVYDPENKDVHG